MNQVVTYPRGPRWQSRVLTALIWRAGLVSVGCILLALTLSPTTDAQIRPTRSNDVAITCTASVVINQASATTTQLVALAANTRIYVCGFTINSIGAATAPTFKFVSGTGASCDTGTTNHTGVVSGAATAGVPHTVSAGGGVGMLLAGALGEALCITTTTTQAQTGVLTYAQF